MTAANYPACFDITLRYEGGYVNHPRDPGGATNRGVIQKVYDGYRSRKNLPRQSVRNIEDSEVREIYKDQYWDRVRGDDLPAGLDLAVWDFGVNSGPTRSIKFLQEILGVQQDGTIGGETLGAIENADSVVLAARLCDDRLAFVKRLSTWDTFGKGWERRISGIKSAASRMARLPPVSGPRPVPDVPDVVPKQEPQAKAEGPIAVTQQDGFWTKIGTILSTVGVTLASILSGLDRYVGVAAVVVGGIGFAIWWLWPKRGDQQ